MQKNGLVIYCFGIRVHAFERGTAQMHVQAAYTRHKSALVSPDQASTFWKTILDVVTIAAAAPKPGGKGEASVPAGAGKAETKLSKPSKQSSSG